MLLLSAYLGVASLLTGLAGVRLAMGWARRLGVLDRPGERKVHQEPIPLAGGWGLFAAFSLIVWGHLLGAFLLRESPLLPAPVRQFAGHIPSLAGKFAPVYAGAVAVFLLGLFDDVRGLSAKLRLMFQIGIGTGLALLGFRPDLGFLPPWAAGAVGVLWIVGITNAFNLLDGLDGLSAGVAMVSTSALLTLMSMGNQPDWLFFLAALAGCLAAFLRYNWHPARVFLGSAGSLLIGYLLAMASLMIRYTPAAHENPLVPLFTPVFIMAIPIYDTTSVVLIRLLQKRSIALGDQSHFHHRMLRLGYTQPQAVTFITLCAFAIAIAGVGLSLATPVQAALILAQILAIFTVLILAERVGSTARRDLLRRREERDLRD